MSEANLIEFIANGVLDGTEINSAGTVYFYDAAATSTPKNVWDTQAKTGARTSVTLDADGRAEVYADGDYYIVVKDINGAVLFTITEVRYGYTEAAAASSDFTDPVTVTSTTQPQLSARYNASNKLDISVNSSGDVTFTPSGGDSTFVGNVNVGTDLSVGGDTTLSGACDVTGDATVGGTLGVTGLTTLASATLTGDLDVGGNATVTGTLEVTGNISAPNLSTKYGTAYALTSYTSHTPNAAYAILSTGTGRVTFQGSLTLSLVSPTNTPTLFTSLPAALLPDRTVYGRAIFEDSSIFYEVPVSISTSGAVTVKQNGSLLTRNAQYNDTEVVYLEGLTYTPKAGSDTTYYTAG